MNQPIILKIRLPFEDNIKDVVERIERFEAFFYNIFHLILNREEVISFEIVQIRGMMNFYIVAPRQLISAIQSYLSAILPDASVEEVSDYADLEHIPEQAVGFHARLRGSEAFSLRSARAIKSDPLNAFFNILSETPTTDAIFYQVLAQTIDESPTGEGRGGLYGFTEKQSTEGMKPKFNTTIRVLYFPRESSSIQTYTAAFENAFSPFSTEHNRIHVETVKNVQQYVDAYFNYTEQTTGVFTTEEVASFFHAPDPNAKIRGMNWLYSRKAEAPMDLPSLKNTPAKDISLFGVTNFRGHQVEFGIRREDRRRHLYVVGKSGTGKSKLLEKLILADIEAGQGVCVIDPHGDLVQALLYRVPKERINDVVYFSPADMNYPIAFNPVANVAREYKQQVTQGLIEIFEKFFGADWSPKIEHVFRFTILALLDYHKATIMGLQKMLTDPRYRQRVIAEIQDHVVKKFWANEFSSWSEKFDDEAIVPLVNKLGQFLSNEMVRNIVAQSVNKVDFDDIINHQRILLVELSKGKLGEENSSLLGSLIVTKIKQTCMGHALISQEKRKDFYLYVDEFQNFATHTFDNILSEARKYRLNLTVSHQYLGQLSHSTREMVFGNVGSIITFRLGAEDADSIAKEFTPRFTGYDMMNLGVREMYLKISIAGVVMPAFSAKTAHVAGLNFSDQHRERVIEASRKKYATPLVDVEKKIATGDAEDLAASGDAASGTDAVSAKVAALASAEKMFAEPFV